jgi:hypothetical protein
MQRPPTHPFIANIGLASNPHLKLALCHPSRTCFPTPEKWDSNDGNTGLQYQIARNMGDDELQIQESISTILEDLPEAQHIARECLHQSKRFALELCQSITLNFQKWKH